ncbi:Bacteriophage/Gene transfer agent portal protein [uncultured Caudovirales phage]|uniref:Bacteriophage/Gene transfer agent portal protein n=1 Tax=uncultured Caudovirales phage TaxID=2100421 RepID=A0A6J7X7E0_9CAUD|nr:Bacteriophage/Gene transfer agent portal protein [uncultured Caudovirales phage]
MNDLITINFSEYSQPKFVEKKSQEWVSYGADNRYPGHLLSLLNTSAKHNAIVNGKANFIAGKGIVFEDETKQYLIQESINRNGETINDILDKVALDIETFGGCYLEVIYNPFGSATSLYHIDYNKVRSNADNTYFYVSEQWDSKNKPDDIEGIAAFDENNKSGKQIIYIKEYRPGVDTYTLPTYQGAMNYIELDVAVSEFHLNAIHNGMMPSKLISFNNGTPSEEEQRTIERRMRDKFAGEANAGKFIINFNNDPAKAPTVLDLSASDLDKQFDLLNKTIQQEIFSGHRITSASLFGIATEGALGARNEMRTAYEIFQNTYVNGKQQFIERWFGYILPLFGINEEFHIQPTEPLGFEFSEQIIAANMTQDEIREKLGLPAIVQLNSQQDIVNSIKSLPQEIAAKVIENMSAEELRGLVGLSNLVQPIQQREQFTTQEDDFAIDVFSEFGTSKSEFQVLKSRRVQFDDNFEPMQHQDFADVDILITEVQSGILDLIEKNALISANEIANALKVDAQMVSGSIANLESNGLLVSTEINKNGATVISRELTEAGKTQKKARKPLAEISIRYSYEVSPGLGERIIDTTRDFCRRLIELDRVYSRKEIEQISQRLGYSVWQRRGGFYHNPKTGVTTPYCRHRWVEQVVIK